MTCLVSQDFATTVTMRHRKAAYTAVSAATQGTSTLTVKTDNGPLFERFTQTGRGEEVLNCQGI